MTESASNTPVDSSLLRARRSPRLIALGVLLIVLGGLGAAGLYASVADHRTAVAMARDVVRGQQLTTADLTVAELPPGVSGGFAPDELDSLVGQRALMDLPAGSYPSPDRLGDLQLEPGQSAVGLKLGPGRLPSSSLVPGQAVQLVGLGETPSITAGTVTTLPELLADGETWVLDVAVTSAEAPTVAALAAEDQLVLVATEGI